MSADYLLKMYRSFGIDSPRLHVVLGSGLSSAFTQLELRKEWREVEQITFTEIPGISKATVSGHPGVMRYYQHTRTKQSLCFQAGRIHGYEGLAPREVVKPLLMVKQAGTERFLLTNAAGSLQRSVGVGSVMIIRDHVNLTGNNPLIGPNPLSEKGTPLGPRFPDMAMTYDKSMRGILSETLEKRGIKVNEGIYLGLMGPSYETPAEVALYSSWGMGAVGMSTVWEALALKHAGATLAGLSVISNMGTGLTSDVLRHEDVEEQGRKIARQLVEALFTVGEHYASL